MERAVTVRYGFELMAINSTGIVMMRKTSDKINMDLFLRTRALDIKAPKKTPTIEIALIIIIYMKIYFANPAEKLSWIRTLA